jgi:hypothetical protein
MSESNDLELNALVLEAAMEFSSRPEPGDLEVNIFKS